MTKKELLNGLNYWLKEKDQDIEEARQKKLYTLALEYSGEAKGYVELAYFLHIIDFEEYKILHNKYYDYYTYYRNLEVFKIHN